MTDLAAGALDPQGPVARAVADLWWLMFALGVAVFAVVAVLLALGLFRRRSPSDQAGGEHGTVRRWVVVGGVVMPLIVIGIVLVATVAAMRHVPNRAPAGALVIEVVGHQWWWEVRYPEQRIATRNEMHIPVGRPVALQLTSADVIHSFWVPPLGGKMDLLPERVNTLVLQADEPGEHISHCAEFCGLEHADMIMTVVAESDAAFTEWIGEQEAASR